MRRVFYSDHDTDTCIVTHRALRDTAVALRGGRSGFMRGWFWWADGRDGPYEDSDRIRFFERNRHPRISLELVRRGGVGQGRGQAVLHRFERLCAVGDSVLTGEVGHIVIARPYSSVCLLPDRDAQGQVEPTLGRLSIR